MEEDFCVGKLLRENKIEREKLLKENCTLMNLYRYMIAGATTSEIFKYIVQFVKEQKNMRKVFWDSAELSRGKFTQEDFNNLPQSQREAMNYAVNCGMVGIIESIIGEQLYV